MFKKNLRVGRGNMGNPGSSATSLQFFILQTLPKSAALYNRVKQFFTVFKFAVKLRLLPADFRRVQLSAFTYHGVKESVMALQKSLQQ